MGIKITLPETNGKYCPAMVCDFIREYAANNGRWKDNNNFKGWWWWWWSYKDVDSNQRLQGQYEESALAPT
eukprot:scaffold405687_cov18-Prasinocladus_malaysianus.AAC.1